MLIQITIPLLVCLIGLVLFFVGNPKGQRLGELMFFAGLFVAMLKLDLHLIIR